MGGSVSGGSIVIKVDAVDTIYNGYYIILLSTLLEPIVIKVLVSMYSCT